MADISIVNSNRLVPTLPADATKFLNGAGAFTTPTTPAPDLTNATGTLAAARIADATIPYAKIQNITAAARLLGRFTAGAGVIQEITLGTGLTLDAATGVLTTSGGGTGDMLKSTYDPQAKNADAFARANFTGTQGLATISGITASKLLGRDATGAGVAQEITLGTNLSLSGTTLNAAAGSGGATALTGLSDVAVASPSDNQVLTYETATAKWKNKTAAAGGGSNYLGGYTKAALPTTGTAAGAVARVTDSTRGLWCYDGSQWIPSDASRRINILDFCNPAALDNTAGIQAAIEVLQSLGGGIIQFPAGYTFKFASQIDLSLRRNIIFEGTSYRNESSTPNLVYTGAGALAAIGIGSSLGIVFKGMHIQYNNPAFTGWLIQSRHVPPSGSDTMRLLVSGCVLQGYGVSNAAGLLDLTGSIIGKVTDSHFLSAKVGIRGVIGSISKTFLPSAVNVAADTITIPNHVLLSGDVIQLFTTGTAPAPLANQGFYYAIPVDANNFKLATSAANALAGTAIDLTGTGTGTHQLAQSEFGYVYQIENNDFNYTDICILNPDANWRITGNTFEPATDGTMRAIEQDSYFPIRGINIDANYFGDVNYGTYPFINLKGVVGGTMQNNWFTLPYNGTAIKTQGAQGLTVAANRFETNDAPAGSGQQSIGINLNGGNGGYNYGVNVYGNSFNVATPIIQDAVLGLTTFGNEQGGALMTSQQTRGMSVTGVANTPSNNGGIDIGQFTDFNSNSSSAKFGVVVGGTMPNNSLVLQSPAVADAPILFSTVAQTAATFTDANVNTTTNRVTSNGHPFATGDKVSISSYVSTSILPAPLAVLPNEYFIIKIDANTVQFANSAANATGNAPIVLTSTGTAGATTQILRGIGTERARISGAGLVTTVPVKVPDTAYSAGAWATSSEVPNKKAVQSAISGIGSGVTLDTAQTITGLKTFTGGGISLGKFNDVTTANTVRYIGTVGDLNTFIYGNSGLGIVNSADGLSQGLGFFTHNAGVSSAQRAFITPAGNFLLGTATDDGTNRLQVLGSGSFTGAATLGTGSTAINKILRGTFSVDPASIAANTVSTQTFTLTGAAVGDALTLNPPQLTTGLLVYQYRVSAANTISITFKNDTAAAIDEVAGSWTYRLER